MQEQGGMGFGASWLKESRRSGCLAVKKGSALKQWLLCVLSARFFVERMKVAPRVIRPFLG